MSVAAPSFLSQAPASPSSSLIVAEAAEIKWRQRNAPRSIQPVAMLKTPQESSRGTVDIHIAQAGAIGFELRVSLVQDIGHDDVIADGLNVEGHEVAWQALIGEWPVVVPSAVFVECEIIMRVTV